MKHRITRLLGYIGFWVTWPGLFVYLKRGMRTRVIIIHDQKILLTRNWYGNGCWSLPGGGQKSDESLSDTAKREVLEETGIEIKESELRELGEHRGSISGLGYRYHLFLYRSIKPPTVSQNTLEIRETIWMSKREVLESSLSSDLKSLSSKWFE